MKIGIKLLFFLLLHQVGYSQTVTLIVKNWAYKKVALVYETDTLVIFHKDSVKNIWYMGGVSLKFKSNNTYTGINTKGNSQSGVWSITTSKMLIVDKDTTQLDQLTSTTIKVSGVAQYHDLGVDITGKILTEFYVIPDVVSTCQSKRTGNWADATTWTCGHEPTALDLVIINLTHIVTVNTSSAQAQRLIYNGGVVKFTGQGTKVFVRGMGD